MTTETHDDIKPRVEAAQKRRHQTAKIRKSSLETITPAEMRTLRLDSAGRIEFEAVAEQFIRCRAELEAFGDEDTASMDDTRYEERSAVEAKQLASGMAIVHFMAPRIRRLREGDAKRKWRSFLTKFMKNERLA
jgi:hypothetical protein